MIKVSKLLLNDGQVPGLPKNPRTIKSNKLEQMKRSIREDPEMLELRELLVYPHGDRFVVVGGNMRLRALRELKHPEAPCKIIPTDTDPRKLRAFALKDNVQVGDWDDYSLQNDWDFTDLEGAGLDIMHSDLNNELVEQEAIRPYRKTHILLSFPPDRLIDIADLIDKLRAFDFIEIEQASN